MPSRSNPNTPSSRKPKTARVLKSKRQHTQRLAANKITKPTARTSQALRQSAPISNKKARKLEKKIGYAKKRAMEEAREVEMKDIDDVKRSKNAVEKGTEDNAEMRMEIEDIN